MGRWIATAGLGILLGAGLLYTAGCRAYYSPGYGSVSAPEVVMLLPNHDDVDVEFWGPGAGVYYHRTVRERVSSR